MNETIQIIGNESSVIYYNLNKQYCNVKKVIFTKEIVLGSFTNSKLKVLISELKGCAQDKYGDILRDGIDAFDGEFNNDFYKQVQESLNKISGGYMDVKLKDYNFMNGVSNSRFNVILRCENFSITSYYVEKGAIMTNMKNLIRDYLKFTGNVFRLSRLDNFQIEIYETEEIHKHVYLKKEGKTLILSSTFGFTKNSPIDYEIGAEFYLSEGPNFEFFKNKQTSAIIREYNKIIEKEIKSQDKILGNENLMMINEKTKNIDDALIECYFNAKNQLKILNISIVDNNFGKYSKNGFVINKSSNNYDSISITTLRDNFDEESVNPKYLLLKSDSDIKELMSDMGVLSKVDGIILTKNFYHPMLDKIGQARDIDIIYSEKSVSRSIEEKIDWENLSLSNSASSHGEANPFAGIISEQNREKDELLERLKNLDLSSPQQSASNNGSMEQIEGVVNNIIGSNESSFKSSSIGGNNKMFGNLNNGKKKSALGLLADSVLSQESRQQQAAPVQQQQPQMQQQPMQQNNMQQGYSQNQYQQPNMQQQQYSQQQPMNQGYNNQGMQQQYGEQQVRKTLNPYAAKQPMIQQQNIGQNNQYPQQPMQQNNMQQALASMPQIDRYDDVLATEIIASPHMNAECYLVDINTISQVNGGKIYFLALHHSEMQNPSMNYILPISQNSPSVKKGILLINNATEYFMIDEKQEGVEYAVNISEAYDKIKKGLIKDMIKKVGQISVICNKADLDILEEYISKIKRIKIEDIDTDEELNEMKSIILTYEKRALMKKLS